MESAIPYYYFPSAPPYLLCAFALAAGIACGTAFEATLKTLVKEWQQNRTKENFLNLSGLSIQVPYAGITISIAVFLSAGLEIFGLPRSLAYPFAGLLTAGSSWFVWRQLGKLLVELEKGGSAAMDLDIWDIDNIGRKPTSEQE
ncbi:hypothetical protein Pse7367_1507 [Thalassoporum mexicanum PCC 7367]|uniref:hypothetical protein n=1 Tax=Thalassoporum mexicanum TaxID=3457544 RepID=UPI00029FDFD0|nr:hypothetical protein [Pseudanabaena sp. PCC 7367]AFY69796.1 hypothetical protein Pse7367_1507 [Pseudanabaena sp. PCC 7367]